MTYAAVHFSADVPDKGHSEFTLVQTGADTGSLNERLWGPGLDPLTASPSSEDTYALTNIRALGDTITADGPRWFWIVPKVQFKLSAANMLPSVEVTISGAPGHNSDTTYPLTPADHQSIVAFLADAKFPVGP